MSQELHGKIFRVIGVRPIPKEGFLVTVVRGDDACDLAWPGTPPALGDLLQHIGEAEAHTWKKVGGAIPGGWDASADPMRWRRPSSGADVRMVVLQKRHAIRRAVREYLDAEGFIEIDTPLLVRGTTPDAGIPSFSVHDRYLVTSTEYQLKRLIVGGFEKIYTLTQNFRHGDQGPQNNPEFSMLEWARVGATLEDIERDAENFVLAAHRAVGGGETLIYGGHRIDLRAPWTRMAVAEAIERHFDITIAGFEISSLQKAAAAAGISIQTSYMDDRNFLFSMLIGEAQGGLGFERPVFLHDWPSFQTSSTPEQEGREIAARSELFVAGLELSDGFPSLTDYKRQAQGFQFQLTRRQAEGSPPVELDHLYLQALGAGLPPGAGMALGFDRLVMLLADQPKIEGVLAFSWDEV